MNLAGKTVIVTGGASGLGEATVRRFVKHGAKAVILDLNEERANKIVDELDPNVLFTKADIESEEQVQAAIDLAIDTYGGLHFLVNCAGILGIEARRTVNRSGPHPLEDFKLTVNSYLVGTFNCIRLAAWAMSHNEPDEDGERGVIINTSSVSAFEGQIGQAGYAAAKAGVSGMTLVIARDLAGIGIRCNTIVPGLFMTPRAEQEPQAIIDQLVGHMSFPKHPANPDKYAHMAQAIVENTAMNGENVRLDSAMRMGPK